MATTKDTDRTPSGVKYRGETFPGFNKPKRAPGDSDKKMRVLAKKGDEIKVVEFGQKGYGHNYSAKARANYLARSGGIRSGSGSLTKNDKFSANYWARRVLWSGPSGSKASPVPGGPRKK
jgi:hypothetical protein